MLEKGKTLQGIRKKMYGEAGRRELVSKPMGWE
jgi:hypothetical protein